MSIDSIMKGLFIKDFNSLFIRLFINKIIVKCKAFNSCVPNDDFEIIVNTLLVRRTILFEIKARQFGSAAKTVAELESMIQSQNSLMEKLTGECRLLTDKLDDASRRHKYELFSTLTA